MDTLENAKITKISQVTPGVTWFLRGLGLSDYYIIKIYKTLASPSPFLYYNKDFEDNKK